MRKDRYTTKPVLGRRVHKLVYSEPPPDDHTTILHTDSIAWALEVKQLIYFYNPLVKSVRVTARLPSNPVGHYPISYDVKVKTNMSLDQVLLNCMDNYSTVTKNKWIGCSHPSLGLRPILTAK